MATCKGRHNVGSAGSGHGRGFVRVRLAVSDTGPIHYVVLIGHVEILRGLVSTVIIPSGKGKMPKDQGNLASHRKPRQPYRLARVDDGLAHGEGASTDRI